MRQKLVFHLMLFFLVSNLGSAICAETRYISDTLYVALREGQGTEYNAIAVLKSDTPVTILKEDDTYVKVQAPDGETGWMPKKYVTSAPPKSMLVEQLEEKVEVLENEAAHQETLASQKAAELEELAEKYRVLQGQSKGAVELNTQIKNIRAENSRLAEEISHLRDENLRLRGNGMLNWFLAGGAVFLVGLLAGKILTPRKGKFY